MFKLKNFGASNNEELKIENGKLKVDDDVSNDRHFEDESPRNPADGKWKINGINRIKHPEIFNSQLSIFNSKKRYGCTLDEDTEIVSEDVNLSPRAGSRIVSEDINLSPLRGKYPPEAGERGLMKRGFTLAEVLITLVVIGVVAAITIPVLHSNTAGKEFNAAKQKARAGLGEAFKLASVNEDLDPELSAKEYIDQILSPKYLKIAKSCDTAEQCGFAKTLKSPEGTAVDRDTVLQSWGSITGNDNLSSKGTVYENAGYFQTLDGFSVAMFYNPLCLASSFDLVEYYNHSPLDVYVQLGSTYPNICFNAVYDMNGAKGPNRAGDDIGFAGSFNLGINAKSAVVLPAAGKQNPKTGNVNYTSTALTDWKIADKYCQTLNGNDYILPTVDEASLMTMNNALIKNSGSLVTRTPIGNQQVYLLLSGGYRESTGHPNHKKSARARCVRADKLM